MSSTHTSNPGFLTTSTAGPPSSRTPPQPWSPAPANVKRGRDDDSGDQDFPSPPSHLQPQHYQQQPPPPHHIVQTPSSHHSSGRPPSDHSSPQQQSQAAPATSPKRSRANGWRAPRVVPRTFTSVAGTLSASSVAGTDSRVAYRRQLSGSWVDGFFSSSQQQQNSSDAMDTGGDDVKPRSMSF